MYIHNVVIKGYFMNKLRHFHGAIPFFIAVFLNAFIDLGHKIVIQNTVFKLYDEQTQVIYTAILNGLILLPFIILLSPAGWLSDTFNKVNVMRKSAVAAVVLCSSIVISYHMGWFEMAFVTTFLLAAQSAIYSPAKLGYIKQMFGKERLGEANGIVSALSIIAILSGIFVFSIFFETLYTTSAVNEADILQAIAPIGWILLLTSIVELVMMYRLPEEPVDHNNPLSVASFPWKGLITGKLFWDDLAPLRNNRSIFLSVIGLSTFWAVGQVMLAAFPAFFKAQTGIDNTIALQGILACSGVGIAIGSVIAGKLSKDHIELGLLPIGALGIATGLFILPGLSDAYLAALTFLGIGVGGGIFIVPLNALIQFQAKENELGKTLAANNWIQNITMLTFLGITVAFSLLDFSSKSLLQLIAVVAFIGCAYTLWQLPQSFARLIITFLLTRHYRVSIQGIKNIPSQGGVLLLGNHVSFIDWAILQLACPRPVRFVMIKNIYEKWYLTWFFDLFGSIPIEQGPRSRKTLEVIATLLDKGEVVCLFPEGTVSRTGHLAEFRAGFEKSAQHTETNVPIVPFYLQGLWGSTFSRSSEKLKKAPRPTAKRDLVISFGVAIPKNTTAEQAKKAIFDLSINSWNTYVESLPSIDKQWIDAAKYHGNKPLIADSSGTRLNGIQALAASTLLARKLKCHIKNHTCSNVENKNIGVLLPPAAGSILINMALLQQGKTLVNLNYTSGLSVLQSVLEQAGITTIIGSTRFNTKLNARGIDIEALFEKVKFIDADTLKEQTSLQEKIGHYVMCRFLPARLLKTLVCNTHSLNNTAAILFSSGSEGTPKGICLSHQNIMANVKQTASVLNMESDDIIFGNLPLFHAFGLTVTQFLPLLESVPVVYHPDPTDALTCAKTIAKHQATIMFGTSTFFRLYCKNKKIHPLMLQSLRIAVSGAEKLNADIRTAFNSKFSIDIYEGYGATETTPVASVNIPDKLSLQDFKVQLGNKTGSVGMPLPGTSCKIVDIKTHAELPTGEAGMILVGGSQVMQGYLNQPEKTDDVIVNINEQRWYITGDKGYIDTDGFLFILDRYSRFAKIGGEMVSLSMVEASYREAIHTLLQIDDYELAATNIPDDKKGERIVILSTIDLNKKFTAEQLNSFGLNNLAIASAYFTVDTLPKLGTGKIDLSTLKKQAKALISI